MPLIHFTDRHLVRLLATETRRTDTKPRDLANSHKAVGRFLAGELAEHLEMEPCDIKHPQGIRQGWKIAREHEIGLLVLMRSGLHVADGVRDILQVAPMFHAKPTRTVGLNRADLAGLEKERIKISVVIDSVVNTGTSLEPILHQLTNRGLRIFVLSLVSPVATADRLAHDWPEVHFLFARTSENQYVGKGTTDTGNRLFGTSHIDDATDGGKRHLPNRDDGNRKVIPFIAHVA